SNNLLGYLPSHFLGLVFAALLLPFILMGLFSALAIPTLEWNRETVLLTLLIIAYLVPHVLILSEDRFHLALVPFFALLAARGWVFVCGSDYRRPPIRSKIIFSVALCILLILNWGVEIRRDFASMQALFGPSGNTTYFAY
ncbi:MAG: hypothetical protein HGA28_05095, partial [Anaerolineaceae bacterium]|nr:hypothetical protein [Anaerolineaceae bacterium]